MLSTVQKAMAYFTMQFSCFYDTSVYVVNHSCLGLGTQLSGEVA